MSMRLVEKDSLPMGAIIPPGEGGVANIESMSLSPDEPYAVLTGHNGVSHQPCAVVNLQRMLVEAHGEVTRCATFLPGKRVVSVNQSQSSGMAVLTLSELSGRKLREITRVPISGDQGNGKAIGIDSEGKNGIVVYNCEGKDRQAMRHFRVDRDELKVTEAQDFNQVDVSLRSTYHNDSHVLMGSTTSGHGKLLILPVTTRDGFAEFPYDQSPVDLAVRDRNLLVATNRDIWRFKKGDDIESPVIDMGKTIYHVPAHLKEGIDKHPSSQDIQALAVDVRGEIAIATTNTLRLLNRSADADGQYGTAARMNFDRDGTGNTSIAFDPAGNLYLAADGLAKYEIVDDDN